MWVCLNDAFLSIVQPPEAERGGADDLLLVRARLRGDIERIFPKARVKRTEDRDYLFRAYIPRERVADAMAAEVRRIHYDNFKNSVPDNDRHDAYAECWGAMFRFQRKRAGASRRRARDPAPRFSWAGGDWRLPDDEVPA